jgi:fructokinase
MQIASMGEVLIDFVALEKGVSVGEAFSFQKAAGGAPANVAVAVKRLGMDSAFLGQVGDDAFGQYLAAVLKDEDVDISGLRFSQEARTMLAFVSLAAGGERSFMFYRHPSADMLMRPEDVNKAVLDASDLFHFGSITLISSPSKEATLAAANYARQQGKLISYDPNLRLALWGSEETAHKGMRLGFDYANILKISDEEISVVLEAGEEISDLWGKYPQLELVFFTRGRNGSIVYTRNGESYEHKGYHVDTIDTTGAGDTFMAAMLVGVLEQLQGNRDFSKLEFEHLLKFANASGALATTGRGAIPSLPNRTQVDAFLRAV